MGIFSNPDETEDALRYAEQERKEEEAQRRAYRKNVCGVVLAYLIMIVGAYVVTKSYQ